jgi:hypothetical protein
MVSVRPSDERRAYLQQKVVVPTVSNFFPLERYYSAADKLYDVVNAKATERDGQLLDVSNHTIECLRALTFEQLYKRQVYLDECYMLGKRYCIYFTDAISSHNYYNTEKFKSLQNKHTAQLQLVIQMLERVVDCMDLYALFRQAEEQRAQQEQERLEQERLDEFRRNFEQQKNESSKNSRIDGTSTSSDSVVVEQSALDKLQKLLPPKEPPLPSSLRTRYQLQITDSDDESPSKESMPQVLPPNYQALPALWNGVVPLPPPLPTTTANGAANGSLPPSYDSVVHGSAATMSHHPYYGALNPPSENGAASHLPSSYHVRPTYEPTPQHPIKQPSISVRQLQTKYLKQYEQLQSTRRIQVSSLSTYQGRVSASTNGCTVISALVAAHHLDNGLSKPSSASYSSTVAITNELIGHVIDTQCGPILRVIRQKLGLGSHALIIPSDVHDYLVDEKILRQEYFAGAAGGNVMDRAHYGEFLSLLTGSGDSNGTNGAKPKTKAAATLFFREHVISIVKFVHPSTGQATFDLIDSLPGGSAGRATRTRCADVASLEVLLQWYTLRKFSDRNCHYIDANPWDDALADVDPRVFQGFVWSC